MKIKSSVFDMLRETVGQEEAAQALLTMMSESSADMDQFVEFLELLDKSDGDMSKVVGLTHQPVSLEQFLEDPYFMQPVFPEIYPEVRKAYHEIIEGGYVQALLMGGIGVAKALSLDTAIPTPSGWKTMGSLVDGDVVYGADGRTCNVVKAHPVRHSRPCYRVIFSDGTNVVADEEHNWMTHTRNDRKCKLAVKQGYPRQGTVKTTKELIDTLTTEQGKYANHSVPLCGAVNGTHQNLPVDPYIFGLWLGDGNYDRPALTTADPELVDAWRAEARHRGLGIITYPLPNNAAATYAISGHFGMHKVNTLRADLVTMGVLKNKHIPAMYLQASVEQRLALLQGLMDSDGTVATSGTCTIGQTSEPIIGGLMELIRSLGLKPTLSQKLGCDQHGNGQTYGFIAFTAYRDVLPVFRLSRKLDKQPCKGAQAYRQMSRYITAIIPVESVPVRCITVDSADSLYLCGEGFIPTHNTTLGQLIQARYLYELSCERFPQARYGQLPSTELVFVMLNRTKDLAKKVTFGGFSRMMRQVPYFREEFPYDDDIESRLVFPRSIAVEPSNADADSILGMATISGISDEMNFLKRITESKRNFDGGVYDQAKKIHTGMIRRQKSRFQKLGKLPGCICVVSSANYAGDFTDTLKQQVLADNDGSTYIYDKTQWDVLPADRYCGKRFRLELGDVRYPSRILEDTDTVRDGAKVLEVPIENKKDFRDDMVGALRDLAGVVSTTQRAYFYDRAKIWGMDKLYKAAGYVNVLDGIQSIDFSAGMIEIDPSFKIPHPHKPRAIHLDLAQGGRGDKCGFAMGFVEDVEVVRSRLSHSAMEDAPKVVFDILLQITSRPNEEIEFADIREFIYALHAFGYPIKYVTFDQFQSVDSRQMLKRAGFMSERQSVEGVEAYEALRTAMWQGRVLAPEHDICFNELAFLEENREKMKIDHVVGKSKDVSDGMCGVYHTLVRRRESWTVDVPTVEINGKKVMVPTTAPVRQHMRKDVVRRGK